MKKSPISNFFRRRQRDPSPSAAPVGKLFGHPLSHICEEDNELPKPIYVGFNSYQTKLLVGLPGTLVLHVLEFFSEKYTLPFTFTLERSFFQMFEKLEIKGAEVCLFSH